MLRDEGAVAVGELGNSGGAIAAYQRAVRRRTHLVEQHPEQLAFHDDLASTPNNLSVVQRIVGE